MSRALILAMNKLPRPGAASFACAGALAGGLAFAHLPSPAPRYQRMGTQGQVQPGEGVA